MATNKHLIPKSPAKRRSLSATPICWAPSVKGKEFLKTVPRQALAAFKANTATATHWYNLSFRIKVTLEVAKLLYTEEAIQGINTSLDATVSIRKRYHASGDTTWSATPEEIELIEMGLDAADTVQDENTRRDMLPAYHAADAYMKANL